jgi:GH24 family phage-related lysozyme (muramidase)
VTRAAIFDIIRPWLDRDGLTRSRIDALDAALTFAGVPVDTEAVTPVLRPSNACLDLIKEFEGCRLSAYPDPGTGGDPWTIGWGSTGPGIAKGVTWTQKQADERLARDVDSFSAKVRGLLGGAQTRQSQFDAMVSLAYNIGIGAFAGSTLLRKHREGGYAGAAAEFVRWNRAGGRILPGLSRRRVAEASLYRR